MIWSSTFMVRPPTCTALSLRVFDQSSSTAHRIVTRTIVVAVVTQVIADADWRRCEVDTLTGPEPVEHAVIEASSGNDHVAEAAKDRRPQEREGRELPVGLLACTEL